MRKQHISNIVFTCLITSLLLAATFLFWRAEQDVVDQNQARYFLEITDTVKDEIAVRLRGYELILRGVKAFYENTDEVSRRQYIDYINTIDFEKNGNGLLAISLVQYVPHSQRQSHLHFMRGQGYESYTIYPEGDRETYAPITYIYPETPANLKAAGFDLLTKQNLIDTLDRSRTSGLMSMSEHITLVQDIQSGDGNLAKVIYLPIYKQTNSTLTNVHDPKTFYGWVSAPFRFKDLVSTLSSKSDGDGIGLDIYEGSVIEQAKHLYGEGVAHTASNSGTLLRQHTIALGGKAWTIAFTGLPVFKQSLFANSHHWIALLGILISILSGWLVWMIGNSKNKALAMAKEMTKDLNLHAKVFESSQEGFFISDAQNNMISINKGFTKITGYSSAEAIGKNPSMLSSGMQDKQFYKVMWDSVLNHHHWHGELFNRRKSGEIYPEYLSISAVVDEHNQITNFVGVFSDLTDSKKAQEEIHSLANYDKLTGLPNRQFLLESIKKLQIQDQSNRYCHALFYIDIDDFKRLNDVQGYEYGDLLLLEVTQRIKSCLRQSDILARLGADEFVVLIQNLNHDTESVTRDVEKIAEKVFNILKQPYQLQGFPYHLAVSIGINIFTGSDKPEHLLKLADVAMSQAKFTGRDKIHFLDQQMQSVVEKSVLLENALKLAIPHELTLHYQPQVHSDGSVHGVEALIRWNSSEHGFVSPAEFIPIAEASGLILQIGHWVLESACQQLKKWENNAIAKHLILAVNVSPVQFERYDFVEQIAQVIDLYKINPDRLKLEITEGLLVKDMAGAINKMQLLKQIGLRISLDDFGTGYSSLTYLKLLPLNQLKIDRSFVIHIDSDPADQAIAKTIVTLGQTLGLNVIAEGVETKAQLDVLVECGCHLFQGYYFSKPLSLEAFDQYLHQHGQM